MTSSARLSNIVPCINDSVVIKNPIGRTHRQWIISSRRFWPPLMRRRFLSVYATCRRQLPLLTMTKLHWRSQPFASRFGSVHPVLLEFGRLERNRRMSAANCGSRALRTRALALSYSFSVRIWIQRRLSMAVPLNCCYPAGSLSRLGTTLKRNIRSMSTTHWITSQHRACIQYRQPRVNELGKSVRDFVSGAMRKRGRQLRVICCVMPRPRRSIV